MFAALMHRAHRMIIGGDAGQNMMRFARHLSVTITSGTGAFILLFFTNVLVARILGPQEYGVYAIIFSVAQILALLFTLELDVSALYFLSDRGEDKKKITASILIMFGINVAVFTFFAVSIYLLSGFSQITQSGLIWAIVIAIAYAAKRLTDAFLRSQERYSAQALLRILEAMIICLGVLGLFFIVKKIDIYAYAIMIVGGAGVFVISGLSIVRSIMSVTQSTSDSINEIFRYNIYGLINAVINGIVKNVDTLLVAAILGTQVAGIYAVYFTAIVVFGARITQLVMSVFFPALRARKDSIVSVFHRVTRMMMRTFVPLAFFAVVGIGAVIFVYGEAYPFVWQWIVLGGIYIAVHFFASLYGWMLSSVSRNGYRQYNMSFFVGFLFYIVVIGGAYMAGIFSITVMIVAMIIYRMICGVVAYKVIKKWCHGQKAVDNCPMT